MTEQNLIDWFVLVKQVKNGYYLSDNDRQELLRLNHLVMEQAHKIHNDSMLEKERVIDTPYGDFTEKQLENKGSEIL